MAAKFELEMQDALRQVAEFSLRTTKLGEQLDHLSGDFAKTGSVAKELATITRKSFDGLNDALVKTGKVSAENLEIINKSLEQTASNAIKQQAKIAESQVKAQIAAAAYRGELEATRKVLVETANNNAYAKGMEQLATLSTKLTASNKLLQAQINSLSTAEGSRNAKLQEQFNSAKKLESAETRQIEQNKQLVQQLDLLNTSLGAANTQMQARASIVAREQAEEVRLQGTLGELRRSYDGLNGGIQQQIAVQKVMNDGQTQAATFTERLNNQLAEQNRKYEALSGGTAEQVARMKVVNKAREDEITLLQRESVALEAARAKQASLNGGMAESLARINEQNRVRTDQIKNEERYAASLNQLTASEARAQAQDQARLKTMEAKNNATRAAAAAETALTEADARNIALTEKLTADLAARNTKTLEAARAAYGMSAAQKELNTAEQQQQAQLAKLIAQRDLLSSSYGKNMAQIKVQISQQEQLNRITAMSTKELLGLTNAQSRHNAVVNVGSQSAASLRAALSGLQANIGMYTSGTIVAASSTYALFSALRSTVGVGAEFTASMAKANAVMNSNNGSWVPEGLGAAEVQVRALGQTTIFTASEVANGLIDLGQAGLSTGEAILALKPTLDLAQIGTVSMSQAADMATNVMMTFGKSAGDLTNIVDVMATAAVDSNTNITELANALTYAGPAAHAAGISFEETTAAVETLSNSGIKSSRAGTALRKLFTSLLNPTKKGAQVLDEYNISTQNADGSTRNLVDIVNQLNKALNATGVSEAQRLSAIQNLVGLYATSPTAALIANAKTLESALYTLENNVTGAAERMRKKMSDTLQVDWKNTLSAYEELQLQVYEKFEAKLRLTSAQITKTLLDLTTPVKVLLNTDGTEQSVQSLVDKANANKAGGFSVNSGGQAVDNATGQVATTKELVAAMDQANQASLTVVSQLDIIIEKFKEWGTTAVEVIGALVVGKAFGALRGGFSNLSSDLEKLKPRLTEIATRLNTTAKAMGATAVITSQTNGVVSATAAAGAAGARGLGLLATGATFAARALNGLAVAGAFLSAAAGWIGVIAGIGYAIYSLWNTDTNKGIVEQGQGVAELKKRYEELQVTLDAFGLAKEKQAIVEQIDAEKKLADALKVRIEAAKQAIATYKAAGIDAPKLELEVSVNEQQLGKTQERIKDFQARVASIGETAQETKSSNDGAIATAALLAQKNAEVERARKDADSDFSDAHDAKQALYIEEKAALEELTATINRQQQAIQSSQSTALSVAETYRGIRAAAQDSFDNTFDKKGTVAQQYAHALSDVAEAQKAVDDAEKNNSGADVADRAGKKLTAAMKTYGEAQQAYGKLRTDLSDATDKLAVAGKPADDKVETFNTRVKELSSTLEGLNRARVGADPAAAAAIDEQAVEVTKKLTEAKNSQFAAQNKIDSAAKAAAKAAGRKPPEEKMSDALDEFVGKANNATTAANAQAAAYAAGSTAVAQYAIDQQVANEELKYTAKGLEVTADMHKRLAAAVIEENNAKQEADVQKSLLDSRTQTQALIDQAAAVYKGTEAIREYNVEQSVKQALLGKSPEIVLRDTAAIRAQAEAQSQANKQLELANQGVELRDQYAPARKYLEDYNRQLEALQAIQASGNITNEEYSKTLKGINDAYSDNIASTTIWGKLTQEALNRVDEAFVDMWKNIGSGFENFSTSLIDAFKQLLAELAHQAITKPILISFTNSILGTNKSGGIGDAIDNLTGGSSGGSGIAGLLNNVKNVFSVGSSNFGQSIISGWNSGEGVTGGLQNAFTNGADYIKSSITSAFSSGAATAASTFTSETASAALAQSYASYGAQFGTGVAGAGAFEGAGSLGASVTSQSAASSLSALSTTLSYIGAVYSVIQSYQDYGAKGAATTAGFAAAGAAIGTYVFPVIGTALGAAIGAVVGSIASSKLFSSGEKYPDLSTSGQGTYDPTTGYKSGGIVQGWQTKAPKYGEAADRAIDSTVNKFTTTLGSLYKAFGVDAQVYAYDLMQVRKTSGKYSTTFGATIDGTGVGPEFHQQFNAADAAEALKHNYDDVMGTFLAKAIVSSKSLPEYFKAQFTEFAGSWDTTADEVIKAIEGVFLRFNGVNDALARINVGTVKLDNSGLIATDNILNMVASMAKLDTATATAQEKVDALNSAVNDYYSAFYSQAEQFDDLKKSLTGAFAGFGLNLPDSKAAYRALVESIDVSTAAGQAMFATFIGLSKSAASYYDALDQQASDAADSVKDLNNKLTDLARARIDTSLKALQDSVDAQKDVLEKAYTTNHDKLDATISAISDSISGLDNALKTLRGSSDDVTKMLYSQARATLQAAVTRLRGGGTLEGFEGLQDALDAVSANTKDSYKTLQDYLFDQGVNAGLVEEIGDTSDDQLSLAKKQLKALEDSYKASTDLLDQQVKDAQNAIDALDGINNSVLSVKDAIKALADNITAALQTMGIKPSENTHANNQALVEQTYKSVLNRDADTAGRDYWVGQLESGKISYGQLAAAIANSAKTSSGSTTVDGKTQTDSSQGSAYLDSVVQKAYQQALGRAADGPGLAYWEAQLTSGAITQAQLIQALKNSAEANKGAGKAYAKGGSFTNGIVTKPTFFNESLMGEAGSEGILPLTNVGGSLGVKAIIGGGSDGGSSGGSSSQSMDAQLTQINQALRAIAKFTSRISDNTKFLETWDVTGLPEERV